MFTKSQLLCTALLAASVSSVVAVPIANAFADIEARENFSDLEARTHGDGSIRPTPQSQNPKKKFQSAVNRVHQVLAITKHKHDEPNHHANAHGNTAHVHDNFHTSPGGGARHATVDYHGAHNQHITRLHIGTDGSRLAGNHMPAHAHGTHAPPNSPTGQGHVGHVGGVPHRSHTLRRRDILEYLEDVLERDLGMEDDLD